MYIKLEFHTAIVLVGESVGLCIALAPVDDLAVDSLTFTYYTIIVNDRVHNTSSHTTACRDATEKLPTFVRFILVDFETLESSG